MSNKQCGEQPQKGDNLHLFCEYSYFEGFVLTECDRDRLDNKSLNIPCDKYIECTSDNKSL